MNFKIGDVVQLNSGGPPMTIIYKIREEKIFVVWQNVKGERHCYNWPPACLNAYTE